MKWGHHPLQFHRQLIQSRFEHDVYFYQSGINYHLDKRLKPGLIAHVEAVRHNAGKGHKIYDFLGDNSHYKERLSTHHNRLIWIRLQKPLLKFRIEDVLKTFKPLLVRLRKNVFSFVGR